MHDHSHQADAAFRLPVAALAAGAWLRLVMLLPPIVLLWLAIAWALGGE